MDDFLKACKENLNLNISKCLVIGHSDAEFGSMMSSISLAFYMQNRRLHNEEDTIDFYIPVVHAPRSLLDAKTAALFYLEKFGVLGADLLCLDDITVDDFNMIIMVDLGTPHLYQEFDPFVVKMIFTKYPNEPDFEMAEDCEFVYKPASAVATIVADYIVQHDPENLTDDDKLSLKILYDCILYQIENNRDSEDLYPHDIPMLSDLEGFLGIPEETYGENLLVELWAACDDYSHLNPMQLLYKFAAGTLYGASGKVVQMCLLPFQFKEFSGRPEFQQGVEEFGRYMECHVLIMFCSTVDEQNNVEEDIAVISYNDNALFKKVLDKLTYDSGMKLSYRGWFLGVGKWYKNHNPEVTMEKINEAIQSVLYF